MTEHTSSPPRLLVIDDDSDLRVFLQDLLMEEGYAVDVAATLDEALAFLDSHVYHLVLTDLLTHSSSDPLRSALIVRDYAHPTPVAALTGWNISSAEVTRAGLARLIPKPFDLSDLLVSISSCLVTSYSADQRRQAEVLARYYDAVNVRDIDACVSLCAEDVRGYLSAEAPGEQKDMLAGQAALRAELEQRLRLSPDMRVEDYLIHPLPKGLAVRYLKSWTPPGIPGERITVTASMLFQFNGERISQISVRLESQRWQALIPEAMYISGAQDSQR